MPYSVPKNIDPNKIFLVNFSELEGRLDPIYYASNFLHRFTQSHSVKLKDVCVSFSSGFGAGKDEQTDEKNGYIQIRPTNINNNGELVFDKNVFVPLQKTVGFVEKRTVLFNNTNSQELVGKNAILLEERELYTSNHITSIVVDETKANAEYIWIILNVYQRNKIFFSLCTNWNNQSGIGLDLLQSLKIPVPPLHIQQQIVNVYNAALSQRKKKLSESKAKLASIDQYLLGELGITLPEDSYEKTFIVNYKDVDGGRLDPMYNIDYYNKCEERFTAKHELFTLKELSKSIFQGCGQDLTENESNKLLKVKNIQVGNVINYLDIENIKMIPNSKRLENGDIISPFIGEAIRQIKFSVFNQDGKYVWTVDNNTGVIRINSSKAVSYFIAEVLNSSIGKVQIEKLISGGGVPFLGANNVKNIKIPLPPLTKQQEIADHISAIRAEAKRLEQEGEEILQSARLQVEQMILGEKDIEG